VAVWLRSKSAMAFAGEVSPAQALDLFGASLHMICQRPGFRRPIGICPSARQCRGAAVRLHALVFAGAPRDPENKEDRCHVTGQRAAPNFVLDQ
jgi:hypothetical protein